MSEQWAHYRHAHMPFSMTSCSLANSSAGFRVPQKLTFAYLSQSSESRLRLELMPVIVILVCEWSFPCRWPVTSLRFWPSLAVTLYSVTPSLCLDGFGSGNKQLHTVIISVWVYHESDDPVWAVCILVSRIWERGFVNLLNVWFEFAS